MIDKRNLKNSVAESWTVRRLIDWCEEYLSRQKIEQARLDAEILLADCLGVERVWLYAYPEEIVSDVLREDFRQKIHRRACREPVGRILGRAFFFRECYKIDASVLFPRKETEFLVEGALEYLQKRKTAFVVDLGTGSACVLLSLLKSVPKIRGFGSDLSRGALKMAQCNARELGLASRCSWWQGDLLAALKEGSVDLLLSNPPYIAEIDADELMPEVKNHDPALALFSGVDGLQFYRRLFPEAFQVLKEGACLGVEVGQGQASLVAALAVGAGLRHDRTVRDYSGIDRILWFSKFS
jgi:release factor glutamine methyltransferase